MKEKGKGGEGRDEESEKRKTTTAPGKSSKVQVDQIKRAGEENNTRFVFFCYRGEITAAREK